MAYGDLWNELDAEERDPMEPTEKDEMKILKWKETKDENSSNIFSRLRQTNPDSQGSSD